MDWLYAVFLALVQGVTEFLPISSSAHLILPSQLFGLADQGLAFDVAVHLGSLIAVILYFRNDLLTLAGACFRSLRGERSADAKLSWLLILATLPAFVFGYFLNDLIEVYARHSLVIATTTILFALLLWWADRQHNLQQGLEKITTKQALLIGGAQALALIPGTSRSGVTITAALFLGYSREAAARFSFLLAVPVILGAGTLKSIELTQSSVIDLDNIIIGVLVSFISAYACIKLFLKLIGRMGMLPFVIYRLILGIVLLVISI